MSKTNNSSKKEVKEKIKPTPAVAKEILQEPKGTHDVLPQMEPVWNRIRSGVDSLASFYRFRRISTPVLEHLSTLTKGIGSETDILEKEVYLVKTRGGDTLAMRPEGTAPVMRSYLQHSLSRQGMPQKLFYTEPMFRHDNPQSGRYRQFMGIGFEIIGGVNDPAYDAQIILIASHLIKDLKIKGQVLRINSIGCKVCRPNYKKALQTYYKPHEKNLCADCQRRAKENPLRLLDCKKESCKSYKEKAPNFFDKLCVGCTGHLKEVLEYLDEMALPYRLDNTLVRGLDYYARTVFEIEVEGKGGEVGALAGGGRYDYLSEMMGGKIAPAVGFGASFERLSDAMRLQEVKFQDEPIKRVFVAHAGSLAKRKAFKMVEALRDGKIPAAEALSRDSLKAQLKAADKEGAVIALIIGQKEIYEESVIIRDLRNGLQETVPAVKMLEEVRKRLKS